VEYLFLIGGLTLIAAFFIGRLRLNEKQELDRLVTEARLVQDDLRTLLTEITVSSEETLDCLEEKIQATRDLMQMPMARAVGGGAAATGYAGSGRAPKVTPINRKRKNNAPIPSASGAEPAPASRFNGNAIDTEKHLQVYHLAAEGLDIREIAERLNLGQGEVGLILNLQHCRK
jgi:hypothetical protein